VLNEIKHVMVQTFQNHLEAGEDQKTEIAKPETQKTLREEEGQSFLGFKKQTETRAIGKGASTLFVSSTGSTGDSLIESSAPTGMSA
jgi:hypothetical protein